MVQKVYSIFNNLTKPYSVETTATETGIKNTQIPGKVTFQVQCKITTPVIIHPNIKIG